MPRAARLKGLNQVYHITQRGNNREAIFESDQEKRLILRFIFEARAKYNFIIYAYCIMDNHYHLAINDNGNDISKVMKEINYRFAKYYNYLHGRMGHVFQERFYSEIVDSDIYLFDVINYIYDNPVRAKIVNERHQYRWSSCRGFDKMYYGDSHQTVTI